MALLARGDGTFTWAETLAGVWGMLGGGWLYFAWRTLRHWLDSEIESTADAGKLIFGIAMMALSQGIATGLASWMIDPTTFGQTAVGAASVALFTLVLCVFPIVSFRSRWITSRAGWFAFAETVLALVSIAIVVGVWFAEGSPVARDMLFPFVALMVALGTWVTVQYDVFGIAVTSAVVSVELLIFATLPGEHAPFFPPGLSRGRQDAFLVLYAGVICTLILIASTIRAWKVRTARLIEWREQAQMQSATMSELAAERLRQRDELSAANRRLADRYAWVDVAFAQLPVGVYVTDKNGATIRRVNQSIRIPGLDEVFPHLSPGQFAKFVSVDRPDGQQSPTNDWPILRALRTGEVLVGEPFRVQTPGGPVSVTINAAPIRNEAGEIDGAVAIVIDQSRRDDTSQAIRESEDRFRFALKSAGMITWDVDLQTNRITRSESMRDWLGLPPAERDLTGEEFLDQIHPHDVERVREILPRLRERDGDRVEFQIIRGDGSVAWLSSYGRPIINPDGSITRAVGVHRDVTVEHTSRGRLLLLESAVVHAHDAVVILDGMPTPGSGRNVLYVNDAFCKMTGYDRDDVVGRTLHVLRGPASDPATLDSLRSALDDGRSHRVELLNYKKDGTAYWVDLALEPVRDGDRLVHWVMIQRDVTPRRQAETLLRESEAKFRGIFENAWAGVSITDETGVFVSANPAFADMLGHKVEDLIGRFPREFTHPDDRACQEPLARAVWAGERDRYQVRKRYLKPDGTTVWTELWFSAIRGPGGEFRSGLGISVDVTERLRLEEQLRQAQKMEAFGQLAGGVAHDFNNLLTAVLGNLALVQLPAGDPNRPLVAAAEQAGTRAADLTRKLLGYARRTNLYLAPVRLGEVIEEVVGILRRTFDPRIVIRAEVGPVAPVRADATLLNQVLFNLCLNSRDAIDGAGEVLLSADGVELEVDVTEGTPDARPGSFVRVTVRDTGRGMVEDVRRRIFEPFFTTKAVGQGTGLGLAMVHGIMKQHGGWVACESQYGVGTRFDLYFPVAGEVVWETELGGAISPSSATPVRSAETARPLPAAPATILLVDDEVMIRNLARAVLEAEGYSVIEAEDGVDAVEKFRDAHDRIDLVILDLTMPRMSGRDAARKMSEIHTAVRILFSSGYSADDVSEMDSAVGMLSKPYRPDNLMAAVRKALAHGLIEA
ncbi:MAG TPA: PAS domain S-box protein [Fimbriiglobus sp.]